MYEIESNRNWTWCTWFTFYKNIYYAIHTASCLVLLSYYSPHPVSNRNYYYEVISSRGCGLHLLSLACCQIWNSSLNSASNTFSSEVKNIKNRGGEKQTEIHANEENIFSVIFHLPSLFLLVFFSFTFLIFITWLNTVQWVCSFLSLQGEIIANLSAY